MAAHLHGSLRTNIYIDATSSTFERSKPLCLNILDVRDGAKSNELPRSLLKRRERINYRTFGSISSLAFCRYCLKRTLQLSEVCNLGANFT